MEQQKVSNWSRFVMAGRAIFTIRNEKNGGRFTYKVSKHKEKDLWFVGVLSGPDNHNSYSYLGTIFGKDGFRLTRKSRFGEDASSYKVFRWLYNKIENKEELPEHIGIYHCGRCARCGRMLTVPESIMMGFGPECMGRVDMEATDTFDNKKVKAKIVSLKSQIEKLEAEL